MGSSSLARDRTWAPCIRSAESWPLDHQGSPHTPLSTSLSRLWLSPFDRWGNQNAEALIQGFAKPTSQVFSIVTHHKRQPRLKNKKLAPRAWPNGSGHYSTMAYALGKYWQQTHRKNMSSAAKQRKDSVRGRRRSWDLGVRVCEKIRGLSMYSSLSTGILFFLDLCFHSFLFPSFPSLGFPKEASLAGYSPRDCKSQIRLSD